MRYSGSLPPSHGQHVRPEERNCLECFGRYQSHPSPKGRPKNRRQHLCECAAVCKPVRARQQPFEDFGAQHRTLPSLISYGDGLENEGKYAVFNGQKNERLRQFEDLRASPSFGAEPVLPWLNSPCRSCRRHVVSTHTHIRQRHKSTDTLFGKTCRSRRHET